jgi:hypothetical protein
MSITCYCACACSCSCSTETRTLGYSRARAGRGGVHAQRHVCSGRVVRRVSGRAVVFYRPGNGRVRVATGRGHWGGSVICKWGLSAD